MAVWQHPWAIVCLSQLLEQAWKKGVQGEWGNPCQWSAGGWDCWWRSRSDRGRGRVEWSCSGQLLFFSFLSMVMELFFPANWNGRYFVRNSTSLPFSSHFFRTESWNDDLLKSMHQLYNSDTPRMSFSDISPVSHRKPARKPTRSCHFGQHWTWHETREWMWSSSTRLWDAEPANADSQSYRGFKMGCFCWGMPQALGCSG